MKNMPQFQSPQLFKSFSKDSVSKNFFRRFNVHDEKYALSVVFSNKKTVSVGGALVLHLVD